MKEVNPVVVFIVCHNKNRLHCILSIKDVTNVVCTLNDYFQLISCISTKLGYRISAHSERRIEEFLWMSSSPTA